MRKTTFILGMLAAALAVACDREMPEENPSCCIYACDGPRVEYFSDHFGSEEDCTMLVESRCALEFPDNPGVMWVEYEGGVEYEENPGLNAVCEARFEARTSTTGP